ncbi:hypothetical protein HMSSN036_41040 [Paenibacillus macerans]|nr:hypothetical protein HMSSN036_41040 [Paenibacillus macerans]
MNKKLQQTLETKKRIADAAKTLIFNKGYKATSIEDIVEASAAAKGISTIILRVRKACSCIL